MSQTETAKAMAAEERTEETRSFVRTVKAASRRKYTPEEKIRIVLEGFQREATVSDLCRREGIKPHSYYAWTKEFMEAGRERLTRDAVRDATQQEVQGLRRSEQRGLEDDAGGGRPPWNRLTLREVDHVLTAAREMPELSPRQLASWVTDNMGFSVSESTVYRILRREGLVKRPEMRLAAGKEYHRKTTGPHQMWATDASYFRVVGWGYYYLVTVMDDYSRFIPSASSGQASPGGFRGT